MEKENQLKMTLAGIKDNLGNEYILDENGKLHKKYSIDDLKQKLINHLYESEELNYCTEEIELLKIILENEKC